MKKWSVIKIATEVIGGICAVVGIIAEFKNTEDLDEQIRRVINEVKEEN